MNDSIFTKIINREIPAAIIYEDDAVVSFLDIKPNNKGHALVVPRTPVRNVFDADPAVLAAMIAAAQKVARAQREALGAEGVNLVMNNEPAAGQEIFHAHLHVIPRFTDDGAFGPFRHLSYDEGELDTLAEQLKKVLS